MDKEQIIAMGRTYVDGSDAGILFFANALLNANRKQGADARPVTLPDKLEVPCEMYGFSRKYAEGWNAAIDEVADRIATRATAPSDAQDAARWRELKQHTHDTEKKRGCTASEYGQANWLLNYATMDDFMDECIKFRARAAIAPREEA